MPNMVAIPSMAQMVGTHAPPRAPRATRSSGSRNSPCSIESTPAATASDEVRGAQAWMAMRQPPAWATSTALASASASKLGTAPTPLRGQSPISLTQVAPAVPAAARTAAARPGLVGLHAEIAVVATGGGDDPPGHVQVGPGGGRRVEDAQREIVLGALVGDEEHAAGELGPGTCRDQLLVAAPVGTVHVVEVGAAEVGVAVRRGRPSPTSVRSRSPRWD